jgi:hypothetical protein
MTLGNMRARFVLWLTAVCAAAIIQKAAESLTADRP